MRAARTASIIFTVAAFGVGAAGCGGSVGVSSADGIGQKTRITVARTSAARKAGISRAMREMANSKTVFFRSIVIRMTKPEMMKNSSTPK